MSEGMVLPVPRQKLAQATQGVKQSEVAGGAAVRGSWDHMWCWPEAEVQQSEVAGSVSTEVQKPEVAGKGGGEVQKSEVAGCEHKLSKEKVQQLEVAEESDYSDSEVPATDSEMPLMKSTWSRFLFVPLAFLRSRNSRWQTSTVPNRPPTSTDTLCTCPSAEYGMLCTCALSSPVPSWILQPRVYFRCVSIPGVMILARKWRYCTQKHVFGVALATRERNRKLQPALCGMFLVDPHAKFEALGPRLRLSKTILWKITSLLILVIRMRNLNYSVHKCSLWESLSSIL